ncbi:MAG: DNA polymerase I, partial [Parachlamydiaceae bacterium]|nr:DNA polymerase I [Parachlamydiaceae bacterium]
MKKLFVLDASAYLYSAYFAIRNMSNAKGESTNALFGFARSVMKLFKDFKPTHFVAVFDGENGIKQRREQYAEYKAHRQATPGDLIYQIERARQLCGLMGIPMLSIPEVEADDTMGSIALWSELHDTEVYLCSGDKDLCQLVNDKVFILNTYKDNLILGAAEIEANYGVPPSLIIDYLAIVGDASDNVPGLAGFGPKTAVKYLTQFGSLENMLNNASAITENKKREVAILNADLARLSQKLVTIDTAVPIPHEPDFYALRQPSYLPLREFYASMNFNSLIKELDALQPVTNIVVTNAIAEEYTIVDDEGHFADLLEFLFKQTEICFVTETSSIKPLQAEIVGFGFGVEPGKAWYVPLNGLLGPKRVLEALKPLFENPNIGFYGHNLKYDYHVLGNHNIHLANVSFDTILASYLLNSHSRQHSLDALVLETFGKMKISIRDLTGKGKDTIAISEVPIEKMSTYCCEDVDYTVRLKLLFSPQVDERGLDKLYYNVELPLMKVLAKMERAGIFLDLPLLEKMSEEITAQIKILEQEIYVLAGEEFNINSPKQLVAIFEKLGIKSGKKTSTGQMKTDSDVLDVLRINYPIAGKLLEYRGLEKMRSTYIDSLPS